MPSCAQPVHNWERIYPRTLVRLGKINSKYSSLFFMQYTLTLVTAGSMDCLLPLTQIFASSAKRSQKTASTLVSARIGPTSLRRSHTRPTCQRWPTQLKRYVQSQSLHYVSDAFTQRSTCSGHSAINMATPRRGYGQLRPPSYEAPKWCWRSPEGRKVDCLHLDCVESAHRAFKIYQYGLFVLLSDAAQWHQCTQCVL